ncbi:MAG: OmpA family protein [Flavobacteriales bacterium]|nr:OmpA family protein [Flavobacteriales bacterium]
MSVKKISKKYVYIPAYFIFVALSVLGLYTVLTRPATHEVEPAKASVVTPVVQKQESAVMACFKKNRKHMEGLLRIVPSAALSDVLERLDQKCEKEICTQFNELATGAVTYERMVQSMNDRDCLNQIYREAIDYHNEVLSKESVIGIFFDEGSAQLSETHRYKLKVILNTYRVKASEYNLLVIGRASASGNPESNKMLSLQRVQSITNYAEALMNGEMQTDYVYFGAEQPRLNTELAELYHIPREDYANAATSQRDQDYEVRLNQSVLVVIYEKKEDPFQIDAID